MSEGESGTRPDYYKTEVEPKYLHGLDLNKPPEVAVECQGVIEAKDLNFNLGNALKYFWRAGEKESTDRKEDLQKALTYLEFELDRLERDGS